MLWHGWLDVGRSQRIELSLHVAWLLTVLVVTWLLGAGLLPRLFPGWASGNYWLVAAGVALIDSLAGLAHELGHAAAAIGRGRHVYSITLYGLAAAARRSAGPGHGENHPRDQLAIALAGPVSHLLVASLLLCAWNFLPIENEPLRVAAGFPAVSNFAAGLFNLLPVSPLDGARAARALQAALFRI